jgi:hypothetical protein
MTSTATARFSATNMMILSVSAPAAPVGPTAVVQGIEHGGGAWDRQLIGREVHREVRISNPSVLGNYPEANWSGREPTCEVWNPNELMREGQDAS